MTTSHGWRGNAVIWTDTLFPANKAATNTRISATRFTSNGSFAEPSHRDHAHILNESLRRARLPTALYRHRGSLDCQTDLPVLRLPFDRYRTTACHEDVIKSFSDADAEKLFTERKTSHRLAPYAKAALRKLDQLDVVDHIDELFIPQGNKLKKLEGSDIWQFRVDGKYRISFRWDGQDAYEVEIGDFH